MERFWKWAPFAAASLLLLGVSASAATAPAASAKPTTPRTLVTAQTKIYAFAQIELRSDGSVKTQGFASVCSHAAGFGSSGGC